MSKEDGTQDYGHRVTDTVQETVEDMEAGVKIPVLDNATHFAKQEIQDQTERIQDIGDRIQDLANLKDPLLKKPMTAQEEVKKVEHEAKITKKSGSTVSAKFQLDMKLSIRVALWVTVFGLPTFSITFATIVFGDSHYADVCGVKLGKYFLEEGKLHDYVPSKKMGLTWTGTDGQVHCGYLPDIYLGYWPTVMQAVIFSVIVSCGNTVQLCWQCIIGTLIAVVNNIIMCGIFKNGAATTYDESPFAIQLVADAIGFDLLFGLVGWGNTIFVTFIYLASKAETNTIKFGISTHVCLAMPYLNPATGPTAGVIPSGMGFYWDSEAVCWFMTALIGSVVAILATLLPLPLLNITKVDDNTQALCSRIASNFGDALEYLCGEAKEPVCKQIASRIERSGSILAGIKADIAAAWWECFDLGIPGKKRQLYEDLINTFHTLQPILRSVRRCVLEEDFEANHKVFFPSRLGLRTAMEKLHDTTKSLMVTLSLYAEDGTIDKEERAKLATEVENVVNAQKNMVKSYLEQTKGLRTQKYADVPGTVRTDLGAEYSFMFSLASWARAEVDFANQFVIQDRGFQTRKEQTLARAAKQAVKNTWNAKEMMKTEQIKYAIRNTISIMLTFWMATVLKETLFTQYSSVMPMTLSLLITRIPAGTFAKSLQRVQGVSLGKILPLMCLCFVNMYPCGTIPNALWHAFAIFIYMWGFIYMYYSSVQFSTVGCLTAAYGCTFFFVRCVNGSSDQGSVYATRYKEIGQIVCGVVVMVSVDAIVPEEPAELKAKEAMRGLKGEFMEAYHQFFMGNKVLLDYYKKIMSTIQYMQGLKEMLDPKLAIAPGMNAPFRYNYYCSLLPLFETFAADFMMLMLATGTNRSESAGEASLVNLDTVTNIMSNNYPGIKLKGLQEIKQQLFNEIDKVFDAILRMMDASSGEVVDDDANINKLTKSASEMKEEFDGTELFVREINSIKELHENDYEKSQKIRVTQIAIVRIQVGLSALGAAKKSLNALAEKVITKNVNV